MKNHNCSKLNILGILNTAASKLPVLHRRENPFMNPLNLIQLKSAWDHFKTNHPKFPKYLSTVYQRGVQEGSLFEFRVTTSDGEELAANLRLKAEDIELFRKLVEMFQ